MKSSEISKVSWLLLDGGSANERTSATITKGSVGMLSLVMVASDTASDLPPSSGNHCDIASARAGRKRVSRLTCASITQRPELVHHQDRCLLSLPPVEFRMSSVRYRQPLPQGLPYRYRISGRCCRLHQPHALTADAGTPQQFLSYVHRPSSPPIKDFLPSNPPNAQVFLPLAYLLSEHPRSSCGEPSSMFQFEDNSNRVYSYQL